MYKIGINFDEISDDIDEAIQVMKECGVRYGELRTLNKKSFVFWADDEVEAFKRKIDSEGIEVVAAASPLFKWYVSEGDNYVEHDSFGFNPRLGEEEKQIIIENAINITARLSIRRLRVFSGLGRTRQAGLKVAKDLLFAKTLELAAEKGIDLYIENEPVCRVHTKKDIIELLGGKDHINLKLWLDIANMIEIGEDIDKTFLSVISPRLEYLHVKDYVMRGNQKVYVPVGEGIIAYRSIFEQIYAVHPDNDLIVTVETHAKSNKPDFSVRSILGIRKIMNNLGGIHDK